MPQINRIRIINFSYNNDKRHIIDESFNFYKGENALLSLANGGGKSVLVQLMMQPIIPMVKLQGRSVRDFFKRKKPPTFVLVEWKLDDMGGYLLTGICIASREVQARENQDIENSIKYFTFTAHYRDSNMFDIQHIPFCKRDTNSVYVLPFKDASELIQEKARDSKLAIKYFGQDESSSYSSDLITYNISQDEWRNIIAKINSDEGGVIEIFEKCKTSQQLMHEWMIKTVEKVIYKDKDDYRKLELMLENLAEEMIGNEQYIYEKATLEHFLGALREYGADVETLVKGYDDQNKIEDTLAAMYRYLSAESTSVTDTIEQNTKAIEEQNHMLKTIDLEERSNEYYKYRDELDTLQIEYDEISEKLSTTQTKLREAGKQRDIQKAAEIYSDIRELKTELSALDEELLRLKGQSVEKEKINSLEYSLRVGYKKRLEYLNEQIQKVTAGIEHKADEISDGQKKETGINKQIVDLSHMSGALERGNKGFLKYEEKIKVELLFTINRNLFGEADPDELNKTQGMLLNTYETYTKEKNDLECKRINYKIRQTEIKKETELLKKKEAELTKSKDELVQAHTSYKKLEEELESILLKYGLDFDKRFNNEELQRQFRVIADDLRQSQFECQRELSSVRKTIESLKRGTLHVSEEFVQFLEANDINFETGENYLRKQHRDIREGLLSNIPLLPYAFILTNEDIEKVRHLYPEHPLYQLIPIISYSSLNVVFDSKGKFIDTGKGTSLLCLYNHKMIDTDNIEDYLKEIERESQELNIKLKHYTESLDEAQKDSTKAYDFRFERGYLHDLETQLYEVDKRLEGLQMNIETLEQESEENEKSISKIFNEIIDKNRLVDAADKNIPMFKEYIEANAEYQDNIKKYNQCNIELNKLTRELEEIKTHISQAIDAKHKYDTEQKGLQAKKSESESKYNRYKDAEEAEVIEQDVNDMEARLDALLREVAGTLENKEIEKKRKNDEVNRKTQEIKRLGLMEEEYVAVSYDESLLQTLEDDYKELDWEKRELDKHERRLSIAKAKAETSTKTALDEVKKLAESPSSRNTIRLNFDERRKESRGIIGNKRKESEELNKKQNLYSRTMIEIDGFIDGRAYDSTHNYTISKSIKEDFEDRAKELKHHRSENASQEKIQNSKYNRMVNDYKEKNSNITNIFKGLDPIKQQAEEDKDKYYYLYERTMNQLGVLGDMIRIYENQLANLERNKNDMVTQSCLHAMQLYEEVQKITRDSSIKLSGKSRPVPMLKITMDPPEEGVRSMEKMRSYVESCAALVRDDMKKDKKKEEIRRNINKYMSSWELLNVISDLSKLVIEAYKIDLNINNSQYKTWEQVMKENSGGERFVSFFAVLAALMAYTRASGRNEDDYTRNKDTKVLIMDNPFGPISSEHLLKPLFDIAKKYGTQLICLTDLKQNSILNCFSLIYMLKIRTSTFGTNEYLKVEEQIRDGAELERDENLEKAIFKASEYVQMKLY